ncbi:MAG: polysaccharide deacetylase family protein [Clostridia bacterium]|nr:polysaccharide deacetylase family protein [Clostridia bacterium]
MRNFYLRFPNGKSKLFTISYDDGVDQDIRLIDLMKKYGIKGTFNINSELFPPEDFCWPQGTIHRRMPVSKLMAAFDTPNVEVAVHGAKHLYPTAVPASVAMCDFIDDRRNLEKLFGRLIRGAAYPFGRYDQSTLEILKNAGIVYCRTTKSTKTFELPGNWLELHPTCHHNDPALFELADKFINTAPRYLPYFFYLWGHSYEFESNDNWDRIESLLDKISHHEDVWYCTNMEAYEYIEAYNRLVYSADGSVIYNPTLIDVWVMDNNQILHIPSGKTIHL